MADKAHVAFTLAERGWGIVPCGPGKRTPSNENGAAAPLTDSGDVLQWWIERPNDNGDVTPPDGAFIVDVDTPKDDGSASLELVQRELGGFTAKHCVQSPSGGWHIYLRADDGDAVPNSVGRVRERVDIRGHHGYVLAPGSEVPEGEYRGALPPAPGDLPAAPRPLVRAARTPNVERHENAEEWQGEPDQPQDVQRARKFLEDEIKRERIADEGGRNHWAFKTAAKLRDLGVSAEKAVELIHATGWDEWCLNPPLDHDELAATVEHAHAYAQRQGGSAATSRDPFGDIEPGEPEPQQERRSRFTFMTPREVREMQPPPFMVDQTIPEGALTMLFGRWGSFKSFVGIDLALSLAVGQDWHGMSIPHARSVVYVAGEGVEDLGNRQRAWEENHGEQVDRNFALVPEMPLFSDEQQAKAFSDDLAEYGQVDLLVLDTLSTAMRGLDENSSKDAEWFRGVVQAIQKRLGCAVMLIHHPAKGDPAAGRGSIAIEAGLDVNLRTEADEGSHEFKLYMTKAKNFPAWDRPMELKAVEVGDSLAMQPIQRPLEKPEAMAQDAIETEQREVAASDTSRLALTLRELLEHYQRQDVFEVETGEMLAQLATELHMTRNALRTKLRDPSAKKLPEQVRRFVRSTDGRGRAATWALPRSEDDGG